MNKREFIVKSFVVCGATMMGGLLLETCQKTNTSPNANVNFNLDLTSPSNSALKTVGGYVQHDKIIVICTGSATYAALSNVCTHMGCTVAYSNGSHELECPCHGSKYDTNGNVLSGPAPKALAKYKASLSGNIITVSS
jgi:cytochrome b6-f complex iron-sulfur subunit